MASPAPPSPSTTTLPVTLPVGAVLIYGLGTIASTTCLIPNNTVFRFGQVSQIYTGGEVFIYPGISVMFKESDVIARLYCNNWPYTFIEAAKLAISEIYTPPAP